jgi:hypothetical protein
MFIGHQDEDRRNASVEKDQPSVHIAAPNPPFIRGTGSFELGICSESSFHFYSLVSQFNSIIRLVSFALD